MHVCPFTNTPCYFHKVTHITSLKDGKVVEQHICSKCTPENLQELENKINENVVEPKFEPGEILALLNKLMKPDTLKLASNLPNVECPSCKITPAEILQKGRFGCSECYDFFKETVKRVLTRCQEGAIKHVGKVPKRWLAEKEARELEAEEILDVSERIQNLKDKIKNAISVENYEVANILKKKIEELEKLN